MPSTNTTTTGYHHHHPPPTTKHKLLFRFLLNVTINGARVFKPDGSTRKSNLKIVNLRRNVSSGHGGIAWEEVIIRNIIGSLYNTVSVSIVKYQFRVFFNLKLYTIL